MVLTPKLETARRLGLLWGAYAVHTRDVESFEDMVAKAKRMALRHHIAAAGDRIILIAGVPFRTPGSTNVLHVVRLTGDELKGYWRISRVAPMRSAVQMQPRRAPAAVEAEREQRADEGPRDRPCLQPQWE